VHGERPFSAVALTHWAPRRGVRAARLKLSELTGARTSGWSHVATRRNAKNSYLGLIWLRLPPRERGVLWAESQVPYGCRQPVS